MELYIIRISVKQYIDVLCHLHRLRFPLPYDNLFIRPESVEEFAIPSPSCLCPSFGEYIHNALFPNGPRNYAAEKIASETIHQLIYEDLFYKGFPTREDYDLHERLINDETFSPSYDELKQLEKMCASIRIYPNGYEFYQDMVGIHKKLLREKGFVTYIHYLQNEAIKNHELQKIEDKRIEKNNAKYFKTPIEHEFQERLNVIRLRNHIKILCSEIISVLFDKVVAYNKYEREKLCTSCMTK